MKTFNSRLSFLCFLLSLFVSAPPAHAQSASVRVSQVGYESGGTPFRAYLMSSTPVSDETFQVFNSKGKASFSGSVGALLGTWSHSKTVTYSVYALDFFVPGGDLYKIKVSGTASATSDQFAVDTPQNLYSGLLLNALFFYETERDGANYIPNALRTAPGHLKDENAHIYQTPPLDANDDINNIPPTPPLVSAQLPNIDAAGGWWDAGDYEKYVETVSYTAALMQIGVRDFPNQMGPYAQVNPPAPPNSISFAGNSPGAPASSDFTNEAQFGVNWLFKMWNDRTKTLYYQVDNTQEWNYYGYGTPTSDNPNCGGTYSTPYCLFTEYDIWTLPQAADHYLQAGDPEPCDPYTSYFICHRPVYLAAPAGSPISPNLAGRLAADFALCYQLNHASNPAIANPCLKDAEDIFALADTSFRDPAPTVNSGSCSNCLLTIVPFDGYPENVWEDDMELGATELYLALASCGSPENLPAGLPIRIHSTICVRLRSLPRTTSPMFTIRVIRTRSICTTLAAWRTSSFTAPWKWLEIPAVSPSHKLAFADNSFCKSPTPFPSAPPTRLASAINGVPATPPPTVQVSPSWPAKLITSPAPEPTTPILNVGWPIFSVQTRGVLPSSSAMALSSPIASSIRSLTSLAHWMAPPAVLPSFGAPRPKAPTTTPLLALSAA